MRLLVILTLISVCTPCFADFSGLYKGQGAASDEGGWDAACSGITIEIQQTPNQLILKQMDFDCGAISQQRSSLVFVLDQGKLKQGEKTLGPPGFRCHCSRWLV